MIDDLQNPRSLQIDYEILLCYYLGQRYQEAIATFENGPLRRADSNFPPFQDLLVILYDCYEKLGQPQRAEPMRLCLSDLNAHKAQVLALSTALQDGDIQTATHLARQDPSFQPVDQFLTDYRHQRKSSAVAQRWNAILPGAGYLYLGQRQSAVTAFLLNGLFIAATWYSFDQGNIPAGVIFASFELGWYFGGIHGAKEEAQLYNERLYERGATPLMNRDGLFPVFQLRYAF